MTFRLWRTDSINKLDSSKPTLWMLFHINMKTVYSTISTRAVVIFSPIIVALVLSVFLPVSYSVGAGQVFVTILSSGTIWGMTYFSIRKSTFYDNLRSTKSTNITLYLSILLSMFVVTFFSQVSYWTSTVIFDSLITSFSEQAAGAILWDMKIFWEKVDWITIIYTWFISILLMFMGSFSTRWILKNDKTYFIVLFTYVLLLLPFGGVIRPFFQQWPDGNITFTDTKWSPIMKISMIFPQSSINYMNFIAVANGTMINGTTETFGHFQFLGSFNWSNHWEWNFCLLYPPIVLLSLAIFSWFTRTFEE